MLYIIVLPKVNCTSTDNHGLTVDHSWLSVDCLWMLTIMGRAGKGSGSKERGYIGICAHIIIKAFMVHWQTADSLSNDHSWIRSSRGELTPYVTECHWVSMSYPWECISAQIPDGPLKIYEKTQIKLSHPQPSTAHPPVSDSTLQSVNCLGTVSGLLAGTINKLVKMYETISGWSVDSQSIPHCQFLVHNQLISFQNLSLNGFDSVDTQFYHATKQILWSSMALGHLAYLPFSYTRRLNLISG